MYHADCLGVPRKHERAPDRESVRVREMNNDGCHRPLSLSLFFSLVAPTGVFVIFAGVKNVDRVTRVHGRTDERTNGETSAKEVAAIVKAYCHLEWIAGTLGLRSRT